MYGIDDTGHVYMLDADNFFIPRRFGVGIGFHRGIGELPSTQALLQNFEILL